VVVPAPAPGGGARGRMEEVRARVAEEVGGGVRGGAVLAGFGDAD
jgi:hypothetical protein